ncbi:molybdopterin-guanine dinucleotide biosynthesis protein B [Candidatus Cloacimonadota bacterium]
MKVFSVAGYHHTGKTTTVVELIKELRSRGFKVESIKDIHSEKFTMEKVDSNTYKHWKASGNTVIARGLQETYQIWHRRLKLSEMLQHLAADYVVVEGMKTAALPRILCANSSNQLDELVNGSVFAISGKYANDHANYKDLPVLDSRKDIGKLADLVEKHVFPVLPLADPECCSACGTDCFGMVGAILDGEKKRNDCLTDRQLNIRLYADNREIKIVPFVQNIMRDVILSLTRNLKGIERGRIKIELDI